MEKQGERVSLEAADLVENAVDIPECHHDSDGKTWRLIDGDYHCISDPADWTEDDWQEHVPVASARLAQRTIAQFSRHHYRVSPEQLAERRRRWAAKRAERAREERVRARSDQACRFRPEPKPVPRPRPIRTRRSSTQHATADPTPPPEPARAQPATAAGIDTAAYSVMADQVIIDEVHLIDGAFNGRVPQDGALGGRNLLLHLRGDADRAVGDRMLTGAVGRWRDRGSIVNVPAHSWHEVLHEAWCSSSMLASAERPESIEAARATGYATAVVVDMSPSDKAFFAAGSSTTIGPCPAETRGKTCVECGFYFDADKGVMKNVAIALEAHGPMARRVRDALVQQRVLVADESHGTPSRER
ncbi:hypothetical protein [Sorangium sp. So ce124]|uniref:hypothetical protein n=1 Tax=Sorangium sp. So ce124 TaxID=3133280 RepID=UPI003F62368C